MRGTERGERMWYLKKNYILVRKFLALPGTHRHINRKLILKSNELKRFVL